MLLGISETLEDTSCGYYFLPTPFKNQKVKKKYYCIIVIMHSMIIICRKKYWGKVLWASYSYEGWNDANGYD